MPVTDAAGPTCAGPVGADGRPGISDIRYGKCGDGPGMPGPYKP